MIFVVELLSLKCQSISLVCIKHVKLTNSPIDTNIKSISSILSKKNKIIVWLFVERKIITYKYYKNFDQEVAVFLFL